MRVVAAALVAAAMWASGSPSPRSQQNPLRPPPTPPQRPTDARPAQSSSPRVRSATGDALDRYLTGHYDAAIAILATVGGFNTQQAQDWIDAKGPAEAPRRRLTAATLVLEIAATNEMWPSQMIEWVCEAFRKAGPPGTSEALWLRASIALAEGDGMWSFLVVEPFGSPAAGATASSGHLAHAEARFPDDPRFLMAEIVAAEVRASQPPPAAGHRDQTTIAADRVTAEIAPVVPLSATTIAMLERTSAVLDRLGLPSDVAIEAHLRQGVVLLRLGRRDRALTELRAADSDAADPAIRFLARLYTGWTLASSGQAADTEPAIAAYRSALALFPGARSATTLLTSILVMNNRLAEAETLAAGLGGPAAVSSDPWRDYARGDYRAYPDLLARLRTAMLER